MDRDCYIEIEVVCDSGRISGLTPTARQASIRTIFCGQPGDGARIAFLTFLQAEFFGSRNPPQESLMSNLYLPFLGLALSLFAFSPGFAADTKHHAAYEACAKACSDCQRVCDMCTAHCTTMVADGKKEHLVSLKECQDCATICSAASQIVARGGPHSMLICDICMKACDQCAKACEKFPDDKHMKACAEECRKCQKACEVMVKHSAS